MKELLLKIKEAGYFLDLLNDELTIYYKKDCFDENILLLIKEHKAELKLLLAKLKKSNLYYNDYIPKSKIQKNYRLSYSQLRIWIMCQFGGANYAYNIPNVYTLKGKLDVDLFKKSLRQVISRHESLRTIFKENEHAEIRQWILSVEDFDFELDYRNLQNSSNKKNERNEVIKQKLSEEFNLESGPLFRIALIQNTDQEFTFAMIFHHIISDGWSLNVFFKDLLSYYNHYTASSALNLPDLNIQYKDFVEWEYLKIDKGLILEDKNYWLDVFNGELPKLNLKTDFERPSFNTFNGGSANRNLNAGIVNRLKTLSNNFGGTVFMSIIGIVNILLHKYTGQHEFVIGTSFAGRSHSELENQIGLFLNTVALRTQFDRNTKFETFLNDIKKITLEAFKHQMFPLDELMEKLKSKNEFNLNSLFEVMVIVNEKSEKDHLPKIEGLEFEEAQFEDVVYSKFDLTFYVDVFKDKLELCLVYNSDIFKPETIENILDDFVELLEKIDCKNNILINELIKIIQTEEEVYVDENVLELFSSKISEDF